MTATAAAARAAALAVVEDVDRGEFDSALGHACDAVTVLWDLKRSRRRGLEHVSAPIARVMADLAGKVKG